MEDVAALLRVIRSELKQIDKRISNVRRLVAQAAELAEHTDTPFEEDTEHVEERSPAHAL